MNLIFSLLLIAIATYASYLISEKQIRCTLQSKWFVLAQHPTLTRIGALLLFSIAVFLLIQHYGVSIGFASFWVLASPLIFFFILYINPLKSTQKS
ncbi:hypothetical protein [Acinetobacter bouvetii]|uniref:DUF1634 domain-containing protein n=1 Tax=Acinetobacter bouvetii TaxID=202951 RepID=A0A811GBG4_9GAMM|nr:hypothetical protein [Acinetobacter bouvetii]CAB1212153.1 hypothetical protein SFB21_0992 [Acinetobacter bouvetii]